MFKGTQDFRVKREDRVGRLRETQPFFFGCLLRSALAIAPTLAGGSTQSTAQEAAKKSSDKRTNPLRRKISDLTWVRAFSAFT
jgi:hypothetical protein